MDRIKFYLFYAIAWPLSWLPIPVLHGVSNVLYLLIYYVARYRRKVVRENLRNSFPEKSEKELLKIEKDFYLFLSDIIVETIKLMHITDEEMQKRMHFTNPEELGRFFDQGKSVVILLGHYGNWEWITSIYLHYHDIIGGELNRPIKNKYFSDFFLKLRSRFGTVNIPKNNALRTIVGYRRDGKTFGLGFIADQTPSKNNLHYWTTFLNQDTSFLNGAERIARSGGYAVVYLDMKWVKRGYYTCDIVTLTENAKETEEDWITGKYAELTERTILRNPAYWLWSHRRWKHKRS